MMQILTRLLLLVWAVLLLSVANGARAGVPLDRIIAIVNSDVIMLSELEEKLRTVRSQMEQQGTQLPPAEALEKQVLDRLIQNRLQLQMASQTGIRVDDETLNRTISNIAAENKVTLTQFRDILEKDGYSYEQFREDIRNEITISRLRQRQVENRITVTDQEIDNYLATQEHQGNVETEIRLAHILIATPDAASPEEIEQARLVADKAREDLKKGQDFAQMAASISDGQQALEGGDLGWRKLEQIPVLFAEYITDMKPGDISELIQSPSGFHIIKLVDIRSSDKLIVQQTQARHILIRTDELTTADIARTKLEQLKLRIDGGDDFAALAKAHSGDSVSAIAGGDLGWVNPGDLVPQFETVMNALKPGEISEPFETDFGWHIVQVLERREHDSTETIKRTKAREAIRNRKINEAVQTWLRQMRDEAYVEYRTEGD
ncbi:MAG: molecular chaperone SurA [Gammaproteobacteria bacterium RBG_16_51_14]|nr:MAG: molecular chaperone SurA [Gammaproteobacteria bacterium RBG_16_51_14]